MITYPIQNMSGEMTPIQSASEQSLCAANSFDDAYRAFLNAYPAYESTRALDVLRAREYTRLEKHGHIYLDYTGGSLYPESLVREHLRVLNEQVLGNPHSKNLTSMKSTGLVEQARESVLQYFNADPDEYVAIFTPNSTGALKLIGESYPFNSDSRYLLTSDNHNSVNGIREFARARGATVTYLSGELPDMRVDPWAFRKSLVQRSAGAANLFAYPAQSNFTGVQHPLEWIAEAQSHGWDVVLDAAAFVPTNPLDLSRWHPDFVGLSFYKIFGYPTGIGCLLARKTALQKLRRPWYAGGTISFSSVVGDGHYLTPGVAGFEDGTVNYLSLHAVELGLQLIESIGMKTIQTRVKCLTGWLIDQLMALHHRNGRPVIQLYGPATTDQRGGTVQVNFFDPDGRRLDCTDVEQLANAAHISLRAGCHCNAGAREIALGFGREDLAPCFINQDQLTFEQFLKSIEGKMTGALRASLGVVSNFADVYAYVKFAKTFIDRLV